MIDTIFAVCVLLLEILGGLLGISYEAINVWLFCVAWPLLTLWLVIMMLRYRKQIKTLSTKIAWAEFRLANK